MLAVANWTQTLREEAALCFTWRSRTVYPALLEIILVIVVLRLVCSLLAAWPQVLSRSLACFTSSQGHVIEQDTLDVEGFMIISP